MSTNGGSNPVTDLTGLGKLIGPFSEGAVGLLRRIFGPAADEAGLVLKDFVSEYRKKRLAKVLDRTNEILEERGKTTKQVAPKLLLPILDSASLEDDDWMAERWAELLATAASEDEQEVHPAFAVILAELTGPEARMLAKFAKAFPVHAKVAPYGILNVMHQDDPEGKHLAQRMLYITNWCRLGLLQEIWETDKINLEILVEAPPLGEISLQQVYGFTDLGRSFLQACGVLEAERGP